MNLKADETFWMSLKDLFVRQISNGFAIDPGLNVSTFRDNAEFVPLAVLHNFVRLQVFFAGQPSAAGRFAVDVACFCSVGSTGLDLALRTVHTTVLSFFFLPSVSLVFERI